jgi:hypothetical protein
MNLEDRFTRKVTLLFNILTCSECIIYNYDIKNYILSISNLLIVLRYLYVYIESYYPDMYIFQVMLSYSYIYMIKYYPDIFICQVMLLFNIFTFTMWIIYNYIIKNYMSCILNLFIVLSYSYIYIEKYYLFTIYKIIFFFFK